MVGFCAGLVGSCMVDKITNTKFLNSVAQVMPRTKDIKLTEQALFTPITYKKELRI